MTDAPDSGATPQSSQQPAAPQEQPKAPMEDPASISGITLVEIRESGAGGISTRSYPARGE
jgi:hypothetical protein